MFDKLYLTCPKCGTDSGDDWSQCGGSCPITASPHFNVAEYKIHDPTGLTFAALRAANLARCPMFVNAKGETRHSGQDWTPNDWMVATFGELGEAANLMKKVRRGDFTIAEVRDKLAQEFSDVVIYLDLMATECGVNLGEAVMKTFNAKSAQLELPLFLGADGPIRK